MSNVPEREILEFANWFCLDRVETFRMDMQICMTPDAKGKHAYMPAVMGCASFIELFAGLFRGNVDKAVPIPEIVNFTNKYLDNSEFTEELVCLFFIMFRHKVAHVSRPYSVFDTHGVHGGHKLLLTYDRRRLSWEITATFKKPAIQIVPDRGEVKKSRRPSWKTAQYSHLCQIHLKRMIRELPNAIIGPCGYLNCLFRDYDARENFRKCMDSFYQ